MDNVQTLLDKNRQSIQSSTLINLRNDCVEIGTTSNLQIFLNSVEYLLDNTQNNNYNSISNNFCRECIVYLI